jgi:hypothetical protein
MWGSVILTPQRVRPVSSVGKILRIIWQSALFGQQDANRLTMPAGSRCWMRCICYGYSPSACSVLESIWRVTLRWTGTLGITSGWTRLYHVKNVKNVSPFFQTALHLTFVSAICTRKAVFSRRYWWTQVDQRFFVKDVIVVILQRPQWPYNSKTAPKTHIGVFFVQKQHVDSNLSL